MIYLVSYFIDWTNSIPQRWQIGPISICLSVSHFCDFDLFLSSIYCWKLKASSYSLPYVLPKNPILPFESYFRLISMNFFFKKMCVWCRQIITCFIFIFKNVNSILLDQFILVSKLKILICSSQQRQHRHPYCKRISNEMCFGYNTLSTIQHGEKTVRERCA